MGVHLKQIVAKPKNKDDCVKSNGCSWDTGDTSTKTPSPATCFNSTGRKTGDGSFFSTSCLMGMGFLAYLALILVGPLLRGAAYLFGGAKDVVKDASRVSGKKLSEMMDKMTEDAHKATERTLKLLEEKGHEINKEIEKAAARSAATQSSFNTLETEAEGSSAPDAASIAESAAKSRAERLTEEQEANKKAFDDDGVADDIRAAAEASDPPPEKFQYS